MVSGFFLIAPMIRSLSMTKHLSSSMNQPITCVYSLTCVYIYSNRPFILRPARRLFVLFKLLSHSTVFTGLAIFVNFCIQQQTELLVCNYVSGWGTTDTVQWFDLILLWQAEFYAMLANIYFCSIKCIALLMTFRKLI